MVGQSASPIFQRTSDLVAAEARWICRIVSVVDDLSRIRIQPKQATPCCQPSERWEKSSGSGRLSPVPWSSSLKFVSCFSEQLTCKVTFCWEPWEQRSLF